MWRLAREADDELKKPRGPSATPERVGSSEGLGALYLTVPGDSEPAEPRLLGETFAALKA